MDKIGKRGFREVEMRVTATTVEDLFAQNKTKTVNQTVTAARYSDLSRAVTSNYSDFENYPLGSFLLTLKQLGDPFYRSFLNAYGEGPFCTFEISDLALVREAGLYVFTTGEYLNDIKYVGSCSESFGRRINQGVGKIRPKNCLLNGQATNCGLNQLIRKNLLGLKLFARVEESGAESGQDLIRELKPEWNRALSRQLML